MFPEVPKAYLTGDLGLLKPARAHAGRVSYRTAEWHARVGRGATWLLAHPPTPNAASATISRVIILAAAPTMSLHPRTRRERASTGISVATIEQRQSRWSAS